MALEGAKSGGGGGAKTAGSARDQDPFAGKRKCHETPLAKTTPPHNEQNKSI
jgi:hypothetical protein